MGKRVVPPFVTRVPVRFGDIDHARVVFYPRFLEYFHDVFEDFIKASGLVYHEIINVRRIGFPAVHADVTYRHPLRFGDVMQMQLTVGKIGNSSIDLCYHGELEGTPVVDATVTVVCTDLDRFTKVTVPADIREKLEEVRA